MSNFAALLARQDRRREGYNLNSVVSVYFLLFKIFLSLFFFGKTPRAPHSKKSFVAPFGVLACAACPLLMLRCSVLGNSATLGGKGTGRLPAFAPAFLAALFGVFNS